MRILLVEDEAPLRETLAARLKREGFAVDTASDGEEALFHGRFGAVAVIEDRHAETAVRASDKRARFLGLLPYVIR